MSEDLNPNDSANEEFIPGPREAVQAVQAVQPIQPTQISQPSVTDSVPNPALTPQPNPADSEQEYRDEFIAQMHHKSTSGKKFGAGKIVAIIVAVLLVLGLGGFFTWWFAYYSNPKVVVADAVAKLLAADNVKTEGAVAVSQGGSEDPTNQFSVLFDNVKSGTTSRLDATIALRGNDDSNLAITTRAVSIGDGTFYVRIDDLQNVFDESLQNGSASEDEAAVAVVGDFLGEIDGEWWQVNIEEILKLAPDYNPETAQPYIDLYNCAFGTLMQDHSEELKTLYEQNPFLVASRATDQTAQNRGNSVYVITIDYDLLASFINGLTSGEIANSLVVCYNDAARTNGGTEEISTEDIPEISADDLRSTFSEDFSFYAEISNFGHEMKRIFGEKEQEGTTISAEFSFDYAGAAVEIPQEYRNLSELKERIEELNFEMFSSSEYYDGTTAPSEDWILETESSSDNDNYPTDV